MSCTVIYYFGCFSKLIMCFIQVLALFCFYVIVFMMCMRLGHLLNMGKIRKCKRHFSRPKQCDASTLNQCAKQWTKNSNGGCHLESVLNIVDVWCKITKKNISQTRTKWCIHTHTHHICFGAGKILNIRWALWLVNHILSGLSPPIKIYLRYIIPYWHYWISSFLCLQKNKLTFSPP